MPTQEDRLAALEQKIASIELELLYEQRKAEEKIPSEQAYNFKEVNHHLTMLLSVASGQERDIKIVKNDLSTIKDRLESMQQHFTTLDGKLEQMQYQFTTLDGKLEQVLQLLTAPPKTDN